MDSFGAWSAWFHGDEAVSSIGAPAPFPEAVAVVAPQTRAKTVQEESAASDVAAIGGGRPGARKGAKRVVTRGCAAQQRVRGELPEAAPARRPKVARLRSFDDWSNWFWRRDWPETAA